jgi:hypothetical protein
VVKAHEMVDSALAFTQYSLRAAIHCTPQISPGMFVFQRDMLSSYSFLLLQPTTLYAIIAKLLLMKASASNTFAANSKIRRWVGRC